MERVDVLTRDPLVLAGAGRVGGAFRRLDAAAARLEPLAEARRGLLTLTRVRLTGLTSPGRGDEALAAALARGAAAGGGEPQAVVRAARRSTAPAVAARPIAPARSLPGRTTVRAAGATAAARNVVKASLEPPAPRAPVGARRRSAARRAAVAETPAPPAGFEAAADAAGLEWVAPRLPGGATAAATPLVDGTPETASPARWVEVPAPPPRRAPAPAREGDPGSAAHGDRPGADAPGGVRWWPGAPVPGHRERVAPIGQGLEALVRAWQTGVHEAAVHGPGPPAVAPAAGRSPLETALLVPRGRTGDRVSERDETVIAVGDALERVLGAELRRYGIEVDAG